jgi:hypothetical protein
MNQNIKELLYEAGFSETYGLQESERLIRFAELIVKDCATVADHWVMFDDGPLTYGPVGEIIRKHFGIT